MYCGFCNSCVEEAGFEKHHRECYEAHMAREYGPNFLRDFEAAPEEVQEAIVMAMLSEANDLLHGIHKRRRIN